MTLQQSINQLSAIPTTTSISATMPMKPPKKKILVINNFYNNGGSSACVLNAIDGYWDSAFEYSFLGNDSFGIDGVSRFRRYLNRQNQKSSLCYVAINGDLSFDYSNIPNHLVYGRTQNVNKKFTRFRELVEFHQPDVIHIYIPGEQPLHYLDAIKDLKIKKICTVLCDQRMGFDPNIFDQITFISKYLYNKNKDLLPPNKGIVIYPGVNKIARYNAGISSQPVLGRISAYCPSKKLEHTIACAKIFPNAKFKIAGQIQNRPYYEHLLKVIKEQDIKNITLNTNISQDQKQQLLNEFDIYHYPTTSECFCISIAEAIGNGMPVISYNNGAVPEFIENHSDNGFALCNDFYDLVRETGKMIDMFHNKKDEFLELGRKNKTIYCKKYTIERYRKDICKLYE